MAQQSQKGPDRLGIHLHTEQFSKLQILGLAGGFRQPLAEVISPGFLSQNFAGDASSFSDWGSV